MFSEFAFVFAMMAAFLFAMAAELMGLSAIVGAFIAGVVLESTHLQRSRSYREGADYPRIVFGSIFFVSLGILVDIETFTLDSFWFLLALTCVAFFTKFIGCALPARLLGMSKKDSLTVGIGMAPKGRGCNDGRLVGFHPRCHRAAGIYIACSHEPIDATRGTLAAS